MSSHASEMLDAVRRMVKEIGHPQLTAADEESLLRTYRHEFPQIYEIKDGVARWSPTPDGDSSLPWFDRPSEAVTDQTTVALGD